MNAYEIATVAAQPTMKTMTTEQLNATFDAGMAAVRNADKNDIRAVSIANAAWEAARAAGKEILNRQNKAAKLAAKK